MLRLVLSLYAISSSFDALGRLCFVIVAFPMLHFNIMFNTKMIVFKPWPHCYDFNADFSRRFVDVLVVVNREYLERICPRLALPTNTYGLSTIKLQISKTSIRL